MLNEGEMLMKKSLIALAVAGAMTAPIVAQADATLYGSIRVGLTNVDTGANEDWQVTDETSRIGIKGDVDLGLEGTTGFFQFETRLRADEGTFAGDDSRLSLVGAKGAWGTAQAGRMYTPHWLWTSAVTDGGWNYVNASVIREVGLRQPNTVAYITPNMGGFQAAAAVIMGGLYNAVYDLNGVGVGGNNNDKDADAYNIAAKFATGGLHVGLSYMSVDSGAVTTTTPVTVIDPNYDALALAASYNFGEFAVNARYQDEELNNAVVDAEIKTYQLGGSYTLGETLLQARWTNLEADGLANDVDGDQWMVGVQQNLGKRARVWVEYADVDDELVAIGNATLARGGVANTGGAGDAISIGYRLDF